MIDGEQLSRWADNERLEVLGAGIVVCTVRRYRAMLDVIEGYAALDTSELLTYERVEEIRARIGTAVEVLIELGRETPYEI